MAALVSSRRGYPSCWSFSAAVSSAGLIVVAPIAARIWRFDLRTASRKARLAFSIKRRRSASLTALVSAFRVACAWPPPRSRATTPICGRFVIHASAVAGSLSDSNATVFRRSRSQISVSQRWLRRRAQSSIPMIVGGAKLGLPRYRAARNRVSLLTGMLNRRAKLAAGRPPGTSARQWMI
jgi:hypothetical protein